MKKPFVFALFLAIGASGGEPLEPFEPPVETSPFELAQDPWLLQYIESEMGVRQIPAGLAEYRVHFGGDGALQGQADCNSLTGQIWSPVTFRPSLKGSLWIRKTLTKTNSTRYPTSVSSLAAWHWL